MIINLAKIRFGGTGNTGGGVPAKPEDFFEKSYTANGVYDVTPQAGHVFSGGHVEVDVHPTESLSLTITESGSYTSNDEFNGYSINVDVEGPKPEETLTQTITENGSHVFNPSEGHVFNSASITVDVPQGITPTGTINISDNGTYDVTDKATAVVAVGGKDYRYRTGTPDVAGLTAIGWTADDIGYYGANNPHYAWENDNYKVSQENIDLYSLDDPNPNLYKDNPNVTFVPNKNMSSYFDKFTSFLNMKYIKSIPLFDTSSMTNIESMFNGCSSLTTIPYLDTSSATNMKLMFQSCSSLTTIPLLDTGSVTNMGSMFRECSSLTTIPLLDTGSVTDMNSMFRECSSLQTIPQLNTSSVTNMGSMFRGCSSLQTIPQLNTSSVTNMGNMFYTCKNLISIPQLNTGSVTDMSNMFYSCKSLVSIPQMDTSKVTNMNFMFAGCLSLQSIPQMDTSKVVNMNNMLESCVELITVGGIDFSGLTSNLTNLFGYSSNIPKLTHFTVNGKINVSIKDSYGFKACTGLDYDSIKSILEAANRTDNVDAKTLTFNVGILDRNGELTALVASCSTKGWTITGLNIFTQPIIESITPSKDHITVSNIKYNDTPDIVTLTVNANVDWTAGGIPGHHGNYFGVYYDYYDAVTDIKTRDGSHVGTSGAWNPQSGSTGETVLTPNYSSAAPSPQSGEYALVGISFRNAKSPYLYQDYYFKVYPDGE